MNHHEHVPILAARLAHDPRLATRAVHFYERLRALPRNRRRWFSRRLRMSLGAAALLLALSRTPAVLPVRAAGRPAGNGQAEVTLARHRHAVLIHPAQRVDLARADEPGSLDHARRGQAVGRSALVVGSPLRGPQRSPIGVSGPSLSATFLSGLPSGSRPAPSIEQGSSIRPRQSRAMP